MITFQKTLLLAGFFILCFGTLGMICQEAIMVIVFIFFVPGPLLGLIISLYKKSTLIKRVLFFLTTCFIYFFALYAIDIANIDYKLSPARISLASVGSAVLLQLFFDLIFKTQINWKDTFIRPAVTGLVASILTVIVAFPFQLTPATGWLTVPLFVALFSIFPFWYFLFGKHLVKTGKIHS